MNKFETDGSKGKVNIDTTHISKRSSARFMPKFLLLIGALGMVQGGVNAIASAGQHHIDLTPVASISSTLETSQNPQQILNDNTVQIVHYHQDKSGRISDVSVSLGAVVHDSATKESKGENAIIAPATSVMNDGGTTVVYSHGHKLNANVEVLTNGLQNQSENSVFQNTATFTLHFKDQASKDLYNKIPGFTLANDQSDKLMNINFSTNENILPGAPIINAQGQLLALNATNSPTYQFLSNATYNQGETMQQNLGHWLNGVNLTQQGSQHSISDTFHTRATDPHGSFEKASNKDGTLTTGYIPNGLGHAGQQFTTNIGEVQQQTVHVYGPNGTSIQAQVTGLTHSLADIEQEVQNNVKTSELKF